MVVLGVICLILYLFYFRDIAYTDDAYVEGNQVAVTPLQDGFVTGIFTDDTFLVEKGELIAQLDETDAKIALNQAIEGLSKSVRLLCQVYYNLFALRSEIGVRKAELIKTKQDWDHRIDVIKRGGVSLENLEHAEAALKASYFELKATESYYQKERAYIQAESIMSHPAVREAADKVRDAWVRLYRCKIYAPVTGLVAQRKAQVGMWLESGEWMMSIIPLDQIWVNANYKETQMKRMRIGQRVKLHSDLYGRRVHYQGKIVGLPGGAGNAFSLLPPQNLSGNWIKIVQRLPVRVEIDPADLKKHPLRIGLSMFATTYLDERGDLVPKKPMGPSYTTPIFTEEERGDETLVREIVLQNVDPELSYYATHPFVDGEGSEVGFEDLAPLLEMAE